MNDHEQHQSDRVGNDVTFAALDLLSGVITANTATFRGFNALAVDHAGRRAGFATFQFTGVENQKVIDGVQKARIGPVIEVTLHGRSRRKVRGSIRHWQPLVAMYRIAFMISRNLVLRGRPPVLAGGNSGPMMSHSASVKSLG